MLFKKSTLCLVVAIQTLLALSFVSAQSPITPDYGKLNIFTNQSLDFESIEKWEYPFGGVSDRLTIYYSENTRFEFITEPGFAVGHVGKFEVDYQLYNSTEQKTCFGEATVVAVEWDGTSGNGLTKLELDVQGDCFRQAGSVSGKLYYNIEAPKVVKQKVSLIVDGLETPNFKSLQMFPDPTNPHVPEDYLTATYEDLRFELYTSAGFEAGHIARFGLHYYNESTNIYKDGCYGDATVKSVLWNEAKPYVIDEIEISFVVHSCQNTNFIVAPTGTFSIKPELEVCEADQALIDENLELKKGIEVLNHEIDSLNIKLDESNLHISKLILSLEAAQEKVQLYYNNLQAEKLLYEQLKISSAKERDALNKQILDLKAQLADALLRVTRAEAALKTALATNASLTAQLTKSKTEITSLKLQVSTLQSANLKLKTENAVLLKTIEDLKKKLLSKRKIKQ